MMRRHMLRIAVPALVLSIFVHAPVAQATDPHTPNRAYQHAVQHQQQQYMKAFQQQQQKVLRQQQAAE
jgi:hypothetical protein